MTKDRDTATAALFARFPHLSRIDSLWGSAECRRWLNELLTARREVPRRGFPREHASTLLALLVEHDRRFPQFDDSGTPPGWSDDERRR